MCYWLIAIVCVFNKLLGNFISYFTETYINQNSCLMKRELLTCVRKRFKKKTIETSDTGLQKQKRGTNPQSHRSNYFHRAMT